MQNSISPVFLQESLKPSYYIKRYDTKAGRSYARVPYDLMKEQVVLLPSVTTIIDKVVPNDELIEWQMSMGKDRAAFVAEKSAHYGTMMHMAFTVFLENKEFALATVPLFVQQYNRNNGIRYDIADFVERLKEDLISFTQWCHDYKVEPIGVEVPLASPTLGYAGTIDLVARITVEERGFFGEVYKTGDKKGQPKESTREVRKVVIVDFKSNRKTFHFSNTLQVEGFYRNLWNMHLLGHEDAQEFIAEASYLWRPSTNEVRISYAFTEQTSPMIAQAGKHYLELYNLLEAKPSEKRTTEISEDVVLRLGEPADVWNVTTQGELVSKIIEAQKRVESEPSGPELSEPTLSPTLSF